MGEACLCPHLHTKKKEEEVPKLFTPLKLGPFELCHRVVLAPLTRCRAPRRIPQPGPMGLYYSQRSTRGGLLITEATVISDTAPGFPDTPGIWSREQIDAWKPIVKAVHDKGAIFFCQIWHCGRMSANAFQPNGIKPVAPTNVRAPGQIVGPEFKMIDFTEPRALETHEIPGIVNDFVAAAKNSIEAGFDGVEVHGAHGYLLDEFLKDGVNHRTDKYGGSIENRARFLFEVVDAVVAAVGADRVGIRLSPFADYGGVYDSDPTALGVYLAKQLDKRKVVYVHFVEPRMKLGVPAKPNESLEPFRKAFSGVFLAAGGFDREDAIDTVESGKADAVVFGRHFLANPDLPRRLRLNAPLNNYHRDSFYSPEPVKGYTDYPCLQTLHPPE